MLDGNGGSLLNRTRIRIRTRTRTRRRPAFVMNFIVFEVVKLLSTSRKQFCRRSDGFPEFKSFFDPKVFDF